MHSRQCHPRYYIPLSVVYLRTMSIIKDMLIVSRLSNLKKPECRCECMHGNDLDEDSQREVHMPNNQCFGSKRYSSNIYSLRMQAECAFCQTHKLRATTDKSILINLFDRTAKNHVANQILAINNIEALKGYMKLMLPIN